MVNQCNFVGRFGKQAEIRYSAAGTAFANVSLAVDDRIKNKAGEWEKKTEWVNLVFIGRLAEIVGEFTDKGSLVYVSGKYQTRKWTDKDGADRYSTEILCSTMQLLGSKGDGQRQQGGHGGNQQYEEPTGFDPNEDFPF